MFPRSQILGSERPTATVRYSVHRTLHANVQTDLPRGNGLDLDLNFNVSPKSSGLHYLVCRPGRPRDDYHRVGNDLSVKWATKKVKSRLCKNTLPTPYKVLFRTKSQLRNRKKDPEKVHALDQIIL